MAGKHQAGSFGLFTRSLVGLDQTAAKEAFGAFLAKQNYDADQINFVNLAISELAQNGVISSASFYEDLYASFSSTGPQGLFTSEQIQDLDEIFDAVRENATAA